MHVAVIGAGIFGASVAYHLAARGAQVTILHVGLEKAASATTFACLNVFGHASLPFFELRRAAIAYHRELATALGCKEVLCMSGTLRLAASDAQHEELERQARVLAARGVRCERLRPQEVMAIEPGIDARHAVMDAFRIADEGSAAPIPLIQNLLRAGHAHGSVLVRQAAVLAGEERPGGVRISCQDGDLFADRVVLAVGTETTALTRLFGQAVAIESHPGVLVSVQDAGGLVNHAVYAGDLHFRAAGRDLLVGHKRDPEMGLAPDAVATISSEIVSDLRDWLPGLTAAATYTAAVGSRPMPTDGLPIIGWLPGRRCVYLAAGHGGITIAPLVGKLAAEEILEDRSLEMLAPFRAERFATREELALQE